MKKDFRNIPQAPERILDAPDLLDDYYLNLLDWSSVNVVSYLLYASAHIANFVSHHGFLLACCCSLYLPVAGGGSTEGQCVPVECCRWIHRAGLKSCPCCIYVLTQNALRLPIVNLAIPALLSQATPASGASVALSQGSVVHS